jgi:hypothetical protein
VSELKTAYTRSLRPHTLVAVGVAATGIIRGLRPHTYTSSLRPHTLVAVGVAATGIIRGLRPHTYTSSLRPHTLVAVGVAATGIISASPLPARKRLDAQQCRLLGSLYT